MQRVYDFLKEAKTYYLCTVDNGIPRVRPFGTVDLYDGKIYIQTGKVKDCSKQMAANPNIAICAMGPGGWIRINAEAVNDDSREAKVHMLEAYPNLKKMYDPDDDNTQVLYLKNARAELNKGQDKIIIEF